MRCLDEKPVDEIIKKQLRRHSWRFLATSVNSAPKFNSIVATQYVLFTGHVLKVFNTDQSRNLKYWKEEIKQHQAGFVKPLPVTISPLSILPTDSTFENIFQQDSVFPCQIKFNFSYDPKEVSSKVTEYVLSGEQPDYLGWCFSCELLTNLLEKIITERY